MLVISYIHSLRDAAVHHLRIALIMHISVRSVESSALVSFIFSGSPHCAKWQDHASLLIQPERPLMMETRNEVLMFLYLPVHLHLRHAHQYRSPIGQNL